MESAKSEMKMQVIRQRQIWFHTYREAGMSSYRIKNLCSRVHCIVALHGYYRYSRT